MEEKTLEVTRYVAEWAAEMQLADIPEGVRATATRHLIDGYGLAVSGVVEEGHQILRQHLASLGGRPEVQVIGTNLRVSAEDAALINGLSIHAMDYDDTQLSTNPDSVYGLLTHPTAPVLGATASAAEVVDCSGADLLTSYIAGVEVACRIADAMNPRHYQTGFHTTGTVGAFGAAIAAGKLLGLSSEELRRAVAIAGTLGGGLRENFGTMTKPLHAGNAARAGVFAARLARKGFTAADNIFEAPRGFYSAAAGGFDEERIRDRLGDPFYFVDPGISIKPYPSGSLSHPGEDAVLALIDEYDIYPADVESATAITNSATTSALKYPLPQTALEAKFSFPFCLAIAILRRKVGIAEFTDEVVRSSEVQELMTRCSHVSDPEIDARGFQHMETRIEIRLRDGKVVDRTEVAATGHPLKPMTRAQLEAKFHECVALAIDRDPASRALEMVSAVEGLPRVATLHETLAGTSA